MKNSIDTLGVFSAAGKVARKSFLLGLISGLVIGNIIVILCKLFM